VIILSKLELKMFPASYGDSFLISCSGNKQTNILIDMGFMSTYTNVIKKELQRLNQKGETLSLLVFTHVDEDHILGGIRFIKENGNFNSPKIIPVEEIWHNSYKHLQFDKKQCSPEIGDESSTNVLKSIVKKGYKREIGVKDISDIGFKDGSTLAGLLYEHGYSDIWNKTFNYEAVEVMKANKHLKTITINEEVKLIILSPDKEKLVNLDQGWKDKLIELGFKGKVESNKLMDDAFEMYMANKSKEVIKRRKVSKVSGEKINVDDISNQDFIHDTSEANGSSISFILEFRGRKLLFLGDSHPDIIERNLLEVLKQEKTKKLYFDAVKISHHGSKHNTSKSLLNLFETNKYLISTNGRGKGFTHPDIETIARIITSNEKNKKTIIFNFKPVHLFEQINNQELQDKYNFKLEFTNNVMEAITNEITVIEFE